MRARHVADELEHLGRRDAIELGAKLERRERVEERVLRDLALRDGEERVEEAVRDARQAQHAVGHLERLRERVAQDEQALLGRLLRHRLADELGARGVLGEHGLEVALEDEGAILAAPSSCRARPTTRAIAVAPVREVAAEIDGDDRRPPRRAGVVSWVGEAGEPLEQDLELEEDLFLALDGERGDTKPRAPAAARAGARASARGARRRRRRSRRPREESGRVRIDRPRVGLAIRPSRIITPPRRLVTSARPLFWSCQTSAAGRTRTAAKMHAISPAAAARPKRDDGLVHREHQREVAERGRHRAEHDRAPGLDDHLAHASPPSSRARCMTLTA